MISKNLLKLLVRVIQTLLMAFNGDVWLDDENGVDDESSFMEL